MLVREPATATDRRPVPFEIFISAESRFSDQPLSGGLHLHNSQITPSLDPALSGESGSVQAPMSVVR